MKARLGAWAAPDRQGEPWEALGGAAGTEGDVQEEPGPEVGAQGQL